MGETGSWENLRFSAVSCENLRFPAVFCANLRLPNPLIYRASRKSAKFCENVHSGSGFSLLLSRFWHALNFWGARQIRAPLPRTPELCCVRPLGCSWFLPTISNFNFCLRAGLGYFCLLWVAKNLAPYRLGKRSHKQNRAKIHQKYRTSYFFLTCLMHFCPILRVAVFSYAVGGQVFPNLWVKRVLRKARQRGNSEGRKRGGQICRGWIWRFWGAPLFSPEVPKYLCLKGFGTSGRKIGAPQKRQIQPRRIWPPICGPLSNSVKFACLMLAFLSSCSLWRLFPCCAMRNNFCRTHNSCGGHLKPITLKPVIRIFCIFRVFVSALSAFSAFSAFSFCGISSDPCFPGGGRDSPHFPHFPLSGLNRWFRKSDRPALGWPALGDRENKGSKSSGKISEHIFRERIRASKKTS